MKAIMFIEHDDRIGVRRINELEEPKNTIDIPEELIREFEALDEEVVRLDRKLYPYLKEQLDQTYEGR